MADLERWQMGDPALVYERMEARQQRHEKIKLEKAERELNEFLKKEREHENDRR